MIKRVRVVFKDGHEEFGNVAYIRMGPPDYNTPEAYSVVLDSKRLNPGYTGTIFPADRVFEVCCNDPKLRGGKCENCDTWILEGFT